MTNATTRKQLFTAVAMLLVAAIALATATYAWFVNNTAVGVDQLDFQASASSSMEISLPDGTDPWDGTVGGISTGAINWTGIIANKDVKKYHGITVETTTFGAVMPASSTDTKNFFTVAADGWDLTALKAKDFTQITDFKNSSQGAIMVPMYIRSSQEMDVYLNAKAGKSFAVDVGTGEITKALRIAIVDPAGNAKIFEPNRDPITLPGRGNTTSKITDGMIDAEKQAITNTDGTVGAQTKLDPAGYTVTDLATGSVGIVDGDENKDKTALFTLKANTPGLMKVYIWLEGCDFDCVSSVSSHQYNVNLNFIGAPKTTTTP